jgi:hypothetical protein
LASAFLLQDEVGLETPNEPSFLVASCIEERESITQSTWWARTATSSARQAQRKKEARLLKWDN